MGTTKRYVERPSIAAARHFIDEMIELQKSMGYEADVPESVYRHAVADSASALDRLRSAAGRRKRIAAFSGR